MHFNDKPSHTVNALISPCPRKSAIPLVVRQVMSWALLWTYPDMGHQRTLYFSANIETLNLQHSNPVDSFLITMLEKQNNFLFENKVFYQPCYTGQFLPGQLCLLQIVVVFVIGLIFLHPVPTGEDQWMQNLFHHWKLVIHEREGNIKWRWKIKI